jgi:hypothetical protein
MHSKTIRILIGGVLISGIMELKADSIRKMRRFKMPLRE